MELTDEQKLKKQILGKHIDLSNLELSGLFTALDEWERYKRMKRDLMNKIHEKTEATAEKAISRLFEHIDTNHWPLIEVRDSNNVEVWMPVSDEFRDDIMWAKKFID